MIFCVIFLSFWCLYLIEGLKIGKKRVFNVIGREILMIYSAAGTSAAAAAVACNAIKASGAIILVEPNDFLDILAKNTDSIVVQSPPGFFTKHKYLTTYKGLFFCTKSRDPLMIPANTEIINAKKIYIPEM